MVDIYVYPQYIYDEHSFPATNIKWRHNANAWQRRFHWQLEWQQADGGNIGDFSSAYFIDTGASSRPAWRISTRPTTTLVVSVFTLHRDHVADEGSGSCLCSGAPSPTPLPRAASPLPRATPPPSSRWNRCEVFTLWSIRFQCKKNHYLAYF